MRRWLNIDDGHCSGKKGEQRMVKGKGKYLVPLVGLSENN